jgi:hypothetical protein
LHFSYYFSFLRPEDLHRIRVEHMERQLANLTGLVQKALVQNPQIGPPSVQQPFLTPGAPGPYRNGESFLCYKERKKKHENNAQVINKKETPLVCVDLERI